MNDKFEQSRSYSTISKPTIYLSQKSINNENNENGDKKFNETCRSLRIGIGKTKRKHHDDEMPRTKILKL